MEYVGTELHVVRDYELTRQKIREVSEPCRKCPTYLEQERLWEESDNVAKNSRKFSELINEILRLGYKKCDHCEAGKQILKLHKKLIKLINKLSDMGWINLLQEIDKND